MPGTIKPFVASLFTSLSWGITGFLTALAKNRASLLALFEAGIDCNLRKLVGLLTFKRCEGPVLRFLQVPSCDSGVGIKDGRNLSGFSHGPSANRESLEGHVDPFCLRPSAFCLVLGLDTFCQLMGFPH